MHQLFKYLFSRNLLILQNSKAHGIVRVRQYKNDFRLFILLQLLNSVFNSPYLDPKFVIFDTAGDPGSHNIAPMCLSLIWYRYDDVLGEMKIRQIDIGLLGGLLLD